MKFYYKKKKKNYYNIENKWNKIKLVIIMNIIWYNTIKYNVLYIYVYKNKL